LPSEGHCRLCVVEVGDGPRTRIVNSCTYPVEKDLVVQTHSDKVMQARRMVLELLLARAPKAKLIQDLARDHGVYETRFNTDDPEELCILCGLCVRTCRDVVGVSAISMAFRTPAKLVATPFLEAIRRLHRLRFLRLYLPHQRHSLHRERRRPHHLGTGLRTAACSVCGNYIAPKAQLEHWAKITGDPVETFYVCRDCR
jgi:bidirectional [NiFe] hydrogenase diaphorase subunit